MSKKYETVTLNNGVEMPMLGLGLWDSRGAEATQAICWAAELGYGLLDTAMFYGNTEACRDGLKKCGLPRNKIMFSSKIWPEDMVEGKQKDRIKEELRRLETDYLDILLIHWPIGDVEETWHAMEDLKDEGLIRVIGLSNFSKDHVDKVLEFAKYKPAIDQFETHPWFTRIDEVKYIQSKGITVEASAPLARANKMDDPDVMAMAERYGKTYAQIVLRWNLQRGVIVLPKSVHKDRIESNLQVFDFELDEKDVELLNAKDEGKYLTYLPGMYDWKEFPPLPADGMDHA